ncbi:hypothetical protein OB919_14590 [Halobacteria archaeon AArc-curdl1]|uniref:Uncharacterized protein n=1 Tax=Natronosalvus hydrolyticus TaxID=2979988 RepID=A0AAP3E7R9_9EURY|nr:hypothetical protein [Halobacteria archaeon AArc-curdl1]
MSLRIDERATDFREIDRFDGGFGWIAHPKEGMQRASHALAIDGDVWVFDPVDADGLDEALAELGTVTGVVVMLDRHKRDAAEIATRHDVPVYMPKWFDGVSEEIDAPVVRFTDSLADTGLEAHVMKDGRSWQEVALYEPDRRILLVPESVGTASYFRAGGEPLGVHPMRRIAPPREELSRFDPEHILVGHGPGIHEDASAVLATALDTARRRLPRAYAGAFWGMLPF